MKKLIRKAVSVLGSVALVGATVSTAFAATYPAPFNDGAYAVVYGASADSDAANVIASGLPSLGGSTTTLVGGESFVLEKVSDKFNLGDTMSSFKATLNDDDMPVFLADGTYRDSNKVKYDFTQRITVPATKLTYFSSTNYENKQPTIGFDYGRNADVLSYTIDFGSGIDGDALVGTTLPIMGNEYYVLEASNVTSELVLLDSSATTLVSEGTPVTVNVGGKDYTVSAMIEADWVKFTVNGETTAKLSDDTLDSEELEDGAVIALIENLYTTRDTGISRAEFTIGTGKLTLRNGNEVEVNEEPIGGVVSGVSYTVNSLNSITIDWNTDENEFLTDKTKELTLPAFNTMKVVYGGIDYPSNTEVVSFDAGQTIYLNVPVKEGNLNLPLAWMNASDVIPSMGDDGDELIVNSTDMLDTSTGYNFSVGDTFVVSYISSDNEDFATYAYEVERILNSSGITTVTLGSLISGGADVSLRDDRAEGTEKGEILFNITSALDVTGVDEWAVITVQPAQGSGATVSVNKIYSVGGLEITLPESSDVEGGSSFTVTVNETDADGKAGQGAGSMVLNITAVADEGLEVTGLDAGTEGTDFADHLTSTGSDVYMGYFYSDVATSWKHDKSGDLSELVIYNPAKEVKATVSIASGAAEVSSDSGEKVFMDDETSSFSDKNIVVVGGSCVNSVAASLIGGAHCGQAFVGATGVGPGEFLIQTFSYSGKVATVVAGYEKDDTAKAAAYLNNAANVVVTDAGTKYKGQTATQSAVKVSP